MTAWQDYGAADFDATRADKRAARQARQDAKAGQAALIFIPTRERETKRAPAQEQLPGQDDLFSDGE
jgi:hypothetical protein